MMRIGQGIDVHRLVRGRKLMLAGVEIPFERGLIGHSDADVAAHAVIDAILGALALGDIGQHFPPRDPLYQDADSLELLARIVTLARGLNHRVIQLDLTIIAEAPRLAPYIADMRVNLARVTGAPLDAVSVKATTTDAIGAIGHGEGIAALALAVLEPIKE
jgi:2-C-methyl-D-erythritol 2,4-cyclodiphosphate synthase